MDDIIITENAKTDLDEILKSHYTGQIFCVYGHENLSDLDENNQPKWYIGQTSKYTDLNKRWGFNGNKYIRKYPNGEYMHPKFAKALVKYGWQAFTHYVLGYYTKNDINNKEVFWISEKKSLEYGYNCNEGGIAGHYETSNKTRKTISESLKGHLVSTETKKKISNSLKTSEKAKQAQLLNFKFREYCFKSGSENHMYGRHEINFIANLGGIRYGKDNSFFGKTHSEEVKNKIRKSRLGSKESQEIIDKKSKSCKTANELRKKLREEHPEYFNPDGVSRPIAMLDPVTNEVIKYFKNSTIAGKELNITHTVINACLKGKQLTSGGYKWKYVLPSEVNYDL